MVTGVRGDLPLVDFPGNREGPLLARSLVPLDRDGIREAAAARREVVLLFDSGDQRRPIVGGFLQPVTETPLLSAALDETLADAPKTVEIDGRRLVLEGRDEIVLRCGESSITLRRDGKVVIRGLYVESHASGTNRLKGATVKIN